jgi:hypothetical protein
LPAEEDFCSTYLLLSRHVKSFEEKLHTRQDQGRLRACACYRVFIWSTRIYQGVQFHPVRCIDSGNLVSNNKAFMKDEALSPAAPMAEAMRDEAEQNRGIRSRTNAGESELVNAAYGRTFEEVELLWKTALASMPLKPEETKARKRPKQRLLRSDCWKRQQMRSSRPEVTALAM